MMTITAEVGMGCPELGLRETARRVWAATMEFMVDQPMQVMKLRTGTKTTGIG